MTKTAMRIDAPTAFLVALDDRLGGLCFSYFDDVGVRIVAVRNVAAACERIPKVLPSVVVVPANLSKTDQRALEDHAAAAGSEITTLAANVTDAAARADLSSAYDRAKKRRAAQSG